MTRIVDALVEQHLVTRGKNAQDGRSTLIAATASGKQLLLKGRERRVRALARQIAALSAAEQRTLQEAAGILKSVIDAI